MTRAEITPAKLAGRCCSGLELGQGVRVHAIADAKFDSGGSPYGTALCKAKPGRRSVGWSHMPDSAVTCPACAKKLPTHWMDDRGYVVTEEFLRSPRSSSDWIDAYNIPCRMVRGKVTPMGQTT